MINRIKKLLNKIISEKWLSNFKPYKEEVSVYDNSDRLEIVKLLKDSPDLRGLVPTNPSSDKPYFIWSGLLANHDDMFDELWASPVYRELLDGDMDSYYRIAIYGPDEVILLDTFAEPYDFQHTSYYRKIRPSSIEVVDRIDDEDDELYN